LNLQNEEFAERIRSAVGGEQSGAQAGCAQGGMSSRRANVS
jgi:hypothetical protein